MPDALLLAAALLCGIAGMGWLALAMDVHWRQLRSGTPARKIIVTLRVLGSTALAASLALCLTVDHVSMASLVWVMTLAASALIIAFTLSTRPVWLAPLLVWLPART
ncbi:MAG: DUF3325 domain-containing protein [Moraxellaceae bacterium]|nr:DUF3325 domain-containing protein [Moraxellaceae bacterium]